MSRLAVSADRVRSSIDSRSIPATKLIAVLTTLVYLGQVVVAYASADGFDKSGGQRAIEALTSGGTATADFLRFGGLLLQTEVVRAEPWRLLSAVFVHIGILHFGFNTYFLLDFGRLAERLVGSARFVVAYVATGIFGFATTVVLSLFSPQGTATAGASGALFGLMGIVLGFLLRRRDPRWKDFAIRAVVFSLLLGFGLNALKTGVRVNNSAHVGGLVCGVLFGVVYGGPRPRSDLWANVSAVVCLVACLASLVLAQRSPLWKNSEFWFFSRRVAPPAIERTPTAVAERPSSAEPCPRLSAAVRSSPTAMVATRETRGRRPKPAPRMP